MNYEYEQTRFSRAILAGLATGVTAVIVSLAYNFIFRGITRLSLTFSYINVATITFASFIFCLIAGLIYHAIVQYYAKAKTWYIVAILVLTALLILPSFGFHRITPAASVQFTLLYIGVMLCNGLLCAFMLPWYSTHKNYFFN